MNYENILQSFLSLNLDIEPSFFKPTAFLDAEVEAQYKSERHKNSKKKKMYSDAFIIFSFLIIAVYIFVHQYGNYFAYICLGCLGISLILIAISYYKVNSSFNVFINLVMIFLLSIFLNLKVIYIAFYKNTPENDNDSEIIRVIIYDFVSTNLLGYMNLDARISVTASLFLLNLSGVIVAQLKSNTNNFYYLEAIGNLAVTIFFYLFKKAWETMDRSTFAEKYRFEKFFYYTRDLIKGLNAYYLNISQDFSVCCDSKMKNMLNEMLIKPKKLGNNSHRSLNFNEITEVIKMTEVNYSTGEENNGELSQDVLNLFTLYNENDWHKGKSKAKVEKLGEKLKALMQRSPPTAHFINVGKFKLKSPVGSKYFDVHFRKFCISENNSVNDILIYDVTDLMKSKHKIYEEGKIKEKIMAKIVHEFKTPINSIIGVIGNMEDTINSNGLQMNKAITKHLETIRNLSTYVIFLISDIIHFTNFKGLQEIVIIPQDINIREITNFGFDILKSLLRCNKSKEEAIKPLLEFEDDIDSLIIKADKIRLKQIILNIISNAVKFTKSGYIKIKCSILADRERVSLSISDTGIGIPDNEQEKLFKDYQMITNDSVNNAMGSGLGLSICKSLASSMNIELSTTSVYGKGSEFSLAVPYIPEADSSLSLIDSFLVDNSSQSGQYESEANLQESKLIDDDMLLPYELTYKLGLESKNEIFLPEPNKKEIIVNPKIKSKIHSAFNVRLGMDECIYPKIQISRLQTIHEGPSKKMNKVSRLSSSFCTLAFPPSRKLTLAIKEKTEKILIVDDNYYNCESTKNILRKILKEAGSQIEIIIGSDGADIIHHIIEDQSKGNEIKCIITDENMEYINGSEAIRIIRNLERRNKIKFVNIISATGNEDTDHSNEIMRAGAQLVLSKPLPRAIIAKALKDLNII